MADNALVRYEVLFLAVPTLTSEEATTIENQFKELISSQKGETISYEKWGKYHLAYEVNKNDYGIYFLSRFALPSQELNEVLEQMRQFFSVKHNDFVMRHVFARLAPGASLEYKRPESMEEAPRHDDQMGKKAPRPYGQRENMLPETAEQEVEVEDDGDQE